MTTRNALLGVSVDSATIADLNARIAEAVETGSRRVIGHHNLHSVYLYHRDERFRAFYRRTDCTHVDGMSLILAGRFLGLPLKRCHRVTYVDWLAPLVEEAARHQWRIFYLGSREGVADRGAEVLRTRFPGIQIATAHGYFDTRPDSAENLAVLEQINRFQPNILFVGMGMPRQEYWVTDNLDRLRVNAILTSGAAIDYVAGEIPTPPRWAGQLSLEWLFRLVAEPRRLWWRYLVEPWFVLPVFLQEWSSQLAQSVRGKHDA